MATQYIVTVTNSLNTVEYVFEDWEYASARECVEAHKVAGVAQVILTDEDGASSIEWEWNVATGQTTPKPLRIERRIHDEVGDELYDEAMESVYDAIDNGVAF